MTKEKGLNVIIVIELSWTCICKIRPQRTKSSNSWKIACKCEHCDKVFRCKLKQENVVKQFMKDKCIKCYKEFGYKTNPKNHIKFFIMMNVTKSFATTRTSRIISKQFITDKFFNVINVTKNRRRREPQESYQNTSSMANKTKSSHS